MSNHPILNFPLLRFSSMLVILVNATILLHRNCHFQIGRHAIGRQTDSQYTSYLTTKVVLFFFTFFYLLALCTFYLFTLSNFSPTKFCRRHQE